MSPISRLALLALALLAAPAAAGASEFCGPDTIRVSSNADTVFVSHSHAYKNCCLVLTVSGGYSDQVISLYEDDIGRPCGCYCCYHHQYTLTGCPTGHYLVKVYNDVGSVLFGEGEVDLTGGGGSLVVGDPVQGDCLIPEATQETTWGMMRLLYR